MTRFWLFQTRSALPWVFVTFLVIMADFAASAISLTDFKYEEISPGSCVIDDAWAGPRKNWTTTILFLYFSRGGALWILNLWSFLTVTAYMMETVNKILKSFKPPTFIWCLSNGLKNSLFRVRKLFQPHLKLKPTRTQWLTTGPPRQVTRWILKSETCQKQTHSASNILSSNKAVITSLQPTITNTQPATTNPKVIITNLQAMITNHQPHERQADKETKMGCEDPKVLLNELKMLKTLTSQMYGNR